MVPWVAAFAVCAVAMTVAMVRFMTALVDPEPSSTARTLWGLGYGLLWVGILYYINHIPRDGIDAGTDPQWISVLAVSGWTTFNALWLMFWFAIGRSQERAGEPAGMPRDVNLLAARARWVALLGAIILGIAMWNIGLPQSATAAAFARGQRLASIALILAGAGFAAFMVGGIRLALYSGGSKSFSLSDLGEAWRRRLWRGDPSWTSAFLMLGGAVAAVAGGLSAGFILGDFTTRVVIVLFVLYGVIQAWRGARRRAT